MHVLGLPPAFVLSQDQTLKLKCCHQHILDVRTSAHLHREANPRESLCLSVLQFQKKPKNRTNSEADTASSGQGPSSAIYRSLIHRNEPNRPHISSVIHQCQRACCNQEAKNQTDAPISRRARLTRTQDAAVSPARPTVSPVRFPSDPASPPPRPVCLSCASAPPVRGLLRLPPNTRNPKIAKNKTFRQEKSQTKQNQQLTAKQSQSNHPARQPRRPPQTPRNTPNPTAGPAASNLPTDSAPLIHRAAMRNRKSTDGNQRTRVFLLPVISRGSRKAAGTGPRSKTAGNNQRP